MHHASCVSGGDDLPLPPDPILRHLEHGSPSPMKPFSFGTIQFGARNGLGMMLLHLTHHQWSRVLTTTITTITAIVAGDDRPRWGYHQAQ